MGFKVSYDNAFEAFTRSGQLKALRVLPLVLLLAACSSVKNPLSPYRIDVQQGNALEQESVDKLKPGLTRSQVRFLLGTPLLVDPFRTNRWDYVFNYRKAGKLAEERRLVLYFDGDVLSRIEAEGFEPKGEIPAAKPDMTDKQGDKSSQKPSEKPAEKTVEPAVTAPAKPAVVETAPATTPAAAPETVKPVPVAAVEAPKSDPVAQPQPKSVAEAAPAAKAATMNSVSSDQRGINETSIVPPLQADQSKETKPVSKPAQVAERAQESVVLQSESNVAALKPQVMPEFQSAPAAGAPASPEAQVLAALNTWAKVWQARDEEAYLAAYAASFRPDGGLSRAEWEKRRRLLLGLARNIEVKIDGPALELVGEDKAQVSFRQFYRSESYQDAVIKQLKFVRVDNLWLIEEERVLAPIKVKK